MIMVVLSYLLFIIIMGRPFEDKKRVMGADGFCYYRCVKCNTYKPETQMGKNSSKSFKIDGYCLECKKKNRSSKKKSIMTQKNKEYGTSWVEPTGRHLNLKYHTLQDDREMEQYLIRMGYDLEQPIWEQFGKRIEEKYGVKLEFDDIPYYERDNE